MPVELVFARQERPAGTSTLDAVRELRDEAIAATVAGNFADRAAAVAAAVPAPVNTLRLGALAYRRDPDGTALTTADGQRWSPDGIITPLHFGAAADGVTDDLIPMRAAIAYAATTTTIRQQNMVLDLQGLKYAVSDTVEVNAPIVARNGFISVTSGFPQGNYILTGAGNFQSQWSRFENIWLDGIGSDGTCRANGIRTFSPDTTLSNVNVRHFPDYGIRMTHRTFADDCSVVQWEWQEPDRLVWANHTGIGISVEHADCIITRATGASCFLPFYCNSMLTQLNGSHFWTSGAADSPPDADVAVFDNTSHCLMTGNYFDNGRVRFVEKFNHVMTGTIFQKNGENNRSAIYCESSSINEKVSGLTIIGSTFNGGYPDGEIAFGGSGTFAPDDEKQIVWYGNNQALGSSPWFDYKAKDRLTIHWSNAKFNTYYTDNYYSLDFARGLRLRAAAKGGAYPVRIAFGTQDAHEFQSDRYDFGIGLSTTGGPLMRITSSGIDGFSFQPANSSGNIGVNLGLTWISASAAWQFLNGRVRLSAIAGQTHSEIRADRTLRLDADWDNDNPVQRVTEFAFGGTVRHRATVPGFEVGVGSGGGGTGAALLVEALPGGIARLSPSNGSGGHDAAKSFEWDGSRWRFRGGRLSMHGLPTSAAGLAAGDVWVDAAAGNVLKIV